MDQVRESEEESDKGRWAILFERSGELFRLMVDLDRAIEALKDEGKDEAIYID